MAANAATGLSVPIFFAAHAPQKRISTPIPCASQGLSAISRGKKMPHPLY
jgi:hypothetical protein